jgi:hypothetical protein
MPAFTGDDLKAMRIVAGGMIAGAVILLGMASALRLTGSMGGDLAIMSWIACAFALVSPVMGTVVGAQVARNPSSGGDPRKASFLVMYGQMEASLLFCGVALMVGSNWWPLLAALVPLGVMVSQFPRGEVPRTG